MFGQTICDVYLYCPLCGLLSMVRSEHLLPVAPGRYVSLEQDSDCYNLMDSPVDSANFLGAFWQGLLPTSKDSVRLLLECD